MSHSRTTITIAPATHPTANLHPWGEADITIAPDITIRTSSGADDAAVAAWLRALAAAAAEAADWYDQQDGVELEAQQAEAAEPVTV